MAGVLAENTRALHKNGGFIFKKIRQLECLPPHDYHNQKCRFGGFKKAFWIVFAKIENDFKQIF